MPRAPPVRALIPGRGWCRMMARIGVHLNASPGSQFVESSHEALLPTAVLLGVNSHAAVRVEEDFIVEWLCPGTRPRPLGAPASACALAVGGNEDGRNLSPIGVTFSLPRSRRTCRASEYRRSDMPCGVVGRRSGNPQLTQVPCRQSSLLSKPCRAPASGRHRRQSQRRWSSPRVMRECIPLRTGRNHPLV